MDDTLASPTRSGFADRIHKAGLSRGWTLILLAIHIVFYWALRRASHLSEADFSQPSFLWAAARASWAWVIVAASVAGYLRFRKRTGLWTQRWQDLDEGRALKRFTLIVALVLVWSYALYDYNLYYNHGHYLERALLVVLACCIGWRPVFIIPFLGLLISVMAQFQYPLGVGYKQTVDGVLVQALSLIASWIMLSAMTRRRQADGVVFLICCLVAGHYFYPGYGKLLMDWRSLDRIGLFAAAAHAHGWLAGASESTIASLTRAALAVNPLLIWLTVLVELGSVFFLARLVAFRVLVLLWQGFHIGVFALSGYFFWPWIVVELTLWFCFFRRSSGLARAVFTFEGAVLSVVLILGIAHWSPAPRLAWFDSGVAYVYSFDVTLEDGSSRHLTPHFFAPYRDVFSFSQFYYLDGEPRLAGAYGAVGDRRLAAAIYRAGSVETVLGLESRQPAGWADEEASVRLDRFISRVLVNLREGGAGAQALRYAHAPPVFWTSDLGFPVRDLESVREVRISRVTSYFDGSAMREIDRKLVRTIELTESE